MGTLRDLLADDAQQEKIINECMSVLDAEVGDKGGLGGMAIKTAYKMAKGVAPGIMRKIIVALLPQFLDALQPFHDEAKEAGKDVKQHVMSKRGDLANALLAVTDARAEREGAGPLKKGYQKLRPSALKHVDAAVPRVADMVVKYAP